MDFTSKLSLYDILTQLISGFLILALFIPIPESTIKCMCMEDSTETYHWIFVIIFSYLIGIIYHRLLEWFRNILDKGIKECYIKLWIGTIFKRNYEKAIEKAQEKSETGNNNLEKYYKAYYSIMDKPAYNTITFLETQEAFLRNITWIVVAYHLCYYCSWIKDTLFECIFILEPLSILPNWLILCVSLVSFLFLILFARYQTQKKIYELVWEAAKYWNSVNEKE